MGEFNEFVPGSGAKRRLSDDEKWRQLANVVNLRSSEDAVLWTISGIFWAAHALLLVALFESGKLPESHAIGVVISAVGLFLSGTQFFLQGRALAYIGWYEELIKKLELALDFYLDYAVSADLNTELADSFLGGKKGNRKRTLWWRVRKGTLFRVRQLMQGCSVLAASAWLAGLGFFIVRLVTDP